MRLFEYAVIKLEKTDRDNKILEEAEIVVPVTPVLARDEDQANLLAARAIPESAIESLDRLQVVVRPFESRSVLGLAQAGPPMPPVLGSTSFYPLTTSGTNATYTNLSSILTTAANG